MDNDSAIADKLGIIKLTFVRESAKCSIAKTQVSRYKSRQILGIAPMGYAACIIIIINLINLTYSFGEGVRIEGESVVAKRAQALGDIWCNSC